MKKTLLFLITLFSFSQLLAQNLEFSQVKLVSTIETVPVGKVWKVTNVMPSATSNSVVSIKVNGINIYVKGRDYISGSATQSAWTVLSGAYWLPAGTTLETHSNCEFISVIEFLTQ